MSSNPTNQPEEDHTSIFAGDPEPPAAGAQIIDEAPVEKATTGRKEVTADGHLRMNVAAGDIDPFDHSKEHAAVQQHQAEEGTAPLPMPPREDAAVNNPGMMVNPADFLRDEMERRFAQEFDDIKVTVTPADRDAFVRAALHDKELILDIELEGVGCIVQVAIAPDEFTTSASAALRKWQELEHISKDSDLQWMLAFQQIHAWYQIRSINGEPTAWSDFWADGMPKLSKIRDAMRNPEVFEPFFQMNATRWRMCLDAVRMAELKYKICMKNWKDRSFFTGADTD